MVGRRDGDGAPHGEAVEQAVVDPPLRRVVGQSRSDVVEEDHDELPGFLVAGRARLVDRAVVDVVRADGRGLVDDDRGALGAGLVDAGGGRRSRGGHLLDDVLGVVDARAAAVGGGEGHGDGLVGPAGLVVGAGRVDLVGRARSQRVEVDRDRQGNGVADHVPGEQGDHNRTVNGMDRRIDRAGHFVDPLVPDERNAVRDLGAVHRVRP